MTLDWDTLISLIRKHERFVLTSHIRPDCDALGSELGMAGILEAMGKEVVIVNGHQTPPMLSFLDPTGSIRVIGENILGADVNGDCLIVLDTSAWAQLGPMAEVLRRFEGTKIVIDHHVGEDDLGAHFFKDTSAEATGHLVATTRKKCGGPYYKADGDGIVRRNRNGHGLVPIRFDNQRYLSNHWRPSGLRSFALIDLWRSLRKRYAWTRSASGANPVSNSSGKQWPACSYLRSQRGLRGVRCARQRHRGCDQLGLGYCWRQGCVHHDRATQGWIQGELPIALPCRLQ